MLVDFYLELYLQTKVRVSVVLAYARYGTNERRGRETYGRSIIQVINRFEYVRTSAFDNVSEEVANRLFGVRSDVVHVFLDGLQTVIINDCPAISISKGGYVAVLLGIAYWL